MARLGSNATALSICSIACSHKPWAAKSTPLFNSISALREIDSNPKNVKVYFSRNELDDNNEYFIGETPLANTRLPRGVIKLRFEKEGYRDRIIITNFGWRVPFRSPNLSKVNSDKVILIDSSTVNIAIAGIVDADPKEINSY